MQGRLVSSLPYNQLSTVDVKTWPYKPIVYILIITESTVTIIIVMTNSYVLFDSILILIQSIIWHNLSFLANKRMLTLNWNKIVKRLISKVDLEFWYFNVQSSCACFNKLTLTSVLSYCSSSSSRISHQILLRTSLSFWFFFN